MRRLLRYVELLIVVLVFAVACATGLSPSPGMMRGTVVDVEEGVVESGPHAGTQFYILTVGIQVTETQYEQTTVPVPWGSHYAMQFAHPGRCVMVLPGTMIIQTRLLPCKD